MEVVVKLYTSAGVMTQLSVIGANRVILSHP